MTQACNPCYKRAGVEELSPWENVLAINPRGVWGDRVPSEAANNRTKEGIGPLFQTPGLARSWPLALTGAPIVAYSGRYHLLLQTEKLSLTALFAMQKSRFVPTIVSILLFTVGNLEFLVFPRLLLVLCTFFILTGMQCNWDEKACISLLLRRLPSKVAVSLAKLHLPLQVTFKEKSLLSNPERPCFGT